MGLSSSTNQQVGPEPPRETSHKWHESTLKELNYKSEMRLEEEKRAEEQKKLEELERSFRRGFKELTIRTGIKSSFPCFPSIFEPKRLHSTRIIWILITICSTAYWIYQTYMIYKLYISYPVASSYSLKIETKPIFPTVTICNIDPFDGYFFKQDINVVLDWSNISVTDSPNLMAFTDLENNAFKSYFSYQSSQNQFDFYLSGFYFRQMLISCEYQGVRCVFTDFYWFHDYNYGNCFRFNGGDPDQYLADSGSHYNSSAALKKSTKLGWQNGLKLELFSGSPQMEQQDVYKTGFRVIIGNQSYVTFPDEDGIDVAVGKQTNIAVSRTFISRLSEPYSNCIDELTSELSQQNANLQEMYNQIEEGKIKLYQQQYCLKICQQFYYVQQCDCYSFELAFLAITSIQNATDATGCYAKNQILCLQNAEIEFANGAAIDTCYAQCPQQCSEVDYELNVNYAAYPSYLYSTGFNTSSPFYYDYHDILNTSANVFNSMQQSFAMVNIYYESYTYTSIEESPLMGINDLIANVGGGMIMFTGSSILALIEFLEYKLTLIIRLLSLKFFQRH